MHACWPVGAPVERTTAAYDYRGEVAAAISTAKLAGAWAAWPALSTALLARLREDPPEVDVVTWVTTRPRRIRERGADHAEHIARELARGLALPARCLLRAGGRAGSGDGYLAVHEPDEV